VANLQRGKLQNVALLAASLLLAGLVGEGMLRVANPSVRQPFQVQATRESERAKFSSHHPLLGWIGTPGAEDDFSYIDTRHHVRQNAHGFRGSEYGFERSPARRVVVLGDSFVWGFGVEDEQIFTSRVERESEGALELVNLGVSGYGNDQALLLWRLLGRRFRPDELLLVVTPYTDIWENVSDEAYGYPKPVFRFEGRRVEILNQPVPNTRPDEAGAEAVDPYLRRSSNRLASRSALFAASLLALARSPDLRARLEDWQLLPRRTNWFPSPPSLYAQPPIPETRAQWDALLRILDLFRTEVGFLEAKLRLLIVPGVEQVYDEQWQAFVARSELPPGSRWDREAPNRILSEYGREHGLEVIDPLPLLRAEARRDPFLYFAWNKHWTAEAHRLVAELVHASLASDPTADQAPPIR
jgi:hypothetical protein